MARSQSRAYDKLRKVKVSTKYIKYAEGSCLIEQGNTKVICTASVEETVPPFLRDMATGWVTAEYNMLPRSCTSRVRREGRKGKISGRTQEIQRLIGRSLRGIVDLKALGERTIILDADVIQADGGTRCASITGSFIALVEALKYLKKQKAFNKLPISQYVAAVSVGIVDGKNVLDLSYDEDSKADVDMNVAMTSDEKLIEVQATAEKVPFDIKRMEQLIKLAQKGITELIEIQRGILDI
jgi:ribonuclease PH